VRSILGELLDRANDVTLLDMEASLEHMSRGTVRHVEALLVIAEPYYRSLETAARLVPLAHGLGIPHVPVVANKVRGPRDAEAIADFCQRHGMEMIACVPFDEIAVEADLAGRAVMDHDPHTPAVAELRVLAAELEGRLA
jgi:CO dehydrogenase maturation factor